MNFEAFEGQATEGLTLREVLEEGSTYNDGDFLIVASLSEHQKCYRVVFQDGCVHFAWKNSPAGRVCKALFDNPFNQEVGFAFMVNTKLKTLGVFGMMKDVKGVWIQADDHLVFWENGTSQMTESNDDSDVSAPPSLPSPTPSRKPPKA